MTPLQNKVDQVLPSSQCLNNSGSAGKTTPCCSTPLEAPSSLPNDFATQRTAAGTDVDSMPGCAEGHPSVRDSDTAPGPGPAPSSVMSLLTKLGYGGYHLVTRMTSGIVLPGSTTPLPG